MELEELYYLRSLVLTEGIEGAAQRLDIDAFALEMFLDFGQGGKRFEGNLNSKIIDLIDDYQNGIVELDEDFDTAYHLINNLAEGQYRLIEKVVENGEADLSYFLEAFRDCNEDLFENCNEFWARFREFYKG